MSKARTEPIAEGTILAEASPEPEKTEKVAETRDQGGAQGSGRKVQLRAASAGRKDVALTGQILEHSQRRNEKRKSEPDQRCTSPKPKAKPRSRSSDELGDRRAKSQESGGAFGTGGVGACGTEVREGRD